MAAPFPITVFGVRYPSLSAAARAFDKAPNTFRRYVTTYHTEPEAALVGTNYLVRIAFVGLNGKAYHYVPWSEVPITTRAVVEHYRPDLLAAYDTDNPTGQYKPFI